MGRRPAAVGARLAARSSSRRVWLVYLAQTVAGGHRRTRAARPRSPATRSSPPSVVSYLVALPACVDGATAAVLAARTSRSALLCVAELPFAHGDALVMCVYIAVLTVAALGDARLPVVVASPLVAVVRPGRRPVAGTTARRPVSTAASRSRWSALAMFGFFSVIRGNRALAEARSEVARLAAENERSRIARDLHDLLGHSLTTITVKAGLARRLARRDPSAATARDRRGRGAEPRRSGRRPGRRRRTTARSPWPASWPPAASCCARPGSPPTCRRRDRRRRRRARRSCSAGCVREGLTNVVRHARARARARSRSRPAGSRSSTTASAAAAGRGNGLAGLRERVDGAPAGARRGRPGSQPRGLAAARCRLARRDRGRAVTIRLLLADDQDARPLGAGRPARSRGRLRGRGRRSAAATRWSPRRARRARRRPARHRDARASTGSPRPRCCADAGARVPGADPDHVRPAGLPAPGDGGRARAGSSSRTPRPSSWPTRSAGSPPASGSSTRRSPRPSPAGPRR